MKRPTSFGLAASAAIAAMSTGLLTPPVHPADAEIKITSDTFGGLRARPIGPAVMGGRIAAIEAIPGDALTIYVGSASGGLWKSSDSGTSFKPIFDDNTQSIGAVKADPSNPKILWVGTGESCVRNSVSVGTGVYRSSDAGDTWQHMGLADSERIAKIAVDAKKSDTVFVCATGRAWSSGGERGVYRTTDAGKTWERVLHVNDDTGCSDLTIDAQDPKILFAGMWQYRRRPDFFTSGGAGSGLYRSLDGGSTWQRLTAGLPTGELGRIAVAQAPSRANVVYSLVEAKKTALYRSDNLGESWTEVNSSFLVQGRPFYFAHLAVDPLDHDTVYKPGFALGISTDGGHSMNSMFSGGFSSGAVHSDHHALWINPGNPKQMLLGTDGGVYASNDGAHKWDFLNSLPVSQFYHVSYDMEHPYNVYGGLQDNGTWAGPSRAPGGVANRHWEMVGFGDGFWAFADPRDAQTLYVEYQGGNILRVNRRTLETQEIKPYSESGEKDLRFNWNTPIHLSPSEPGTLYVGAQYLFRSKDRGASWNRISPDLTTNDPARQQQEESGGLTRDNSTAENNTTIYAISESPKNKSVIWAGTDDGNLQISRDAGVSWTNVVKNVPGVPAGTWVSRVEASPHAEGRAYVTFDGHRSGDMKTYVFRTDDFGATWRTVTASPVEGYAFILREDPVNPRLLFLGTEFGLWISLDEGKQWARFSGNLPKVAVHDIAIHPREHDVILATHGRGVYIIDDITPIRALTTEMMAKEVALLPARVAQMTIEAQAYPFGAAGDFVGANPSEAATITYWLRKRHLFGDLKIEIHDAEGKMITSIPGTKRVGINRVEWPMRLKPPKVPPATTLVPAFAGPRVLEGSYTIKLIKAKETLEGKVTITADPRSTHPAADRTLQQKSAMQVYRDLEELSYVVEATAAGRDAARAASDKAGKASGLGKKATGLADSFEAFRVSLVATKEGAGISGEEKLREKLGNIYGGINAYDGKPTASQMSRKENLEKELAATLAKFKELVASAELAAVNALLEKKKLAPIAFPTKEEWLKKQEAGS